MSTKQMPDPFNGMPVRVFHHHASTMDGRTMLRKLREDKADKEGEPLEYVGWRIHKGKMWMYLTQSVHAKHTNP